MDYLHHRTTVTVVNSTQSDELYVSCRIPQGSVLGPYLFVHQWHARQRDIRSTIPVCWWQHNLLYLIIDLENSFVTKLNLLKTCSFLRRKSLLYLYLKVILPSVAYGITIWGNCNNLDHIQSLQTLHCRAARLIYNLPWDTWKLWM